MPSYLSLGAHLQIRDKSVIFHVFITSQQKYCFWTKGNCLSPNCEEKEASFSLKRSMLTGSFSKTVKNATKRAFAKKIAHGWTNIFSVYKNFWSAPLPGYHVICHPAICFLYQSSHLDTGDNKCSLEFNATDEVKDKGALKNRSYFLIRTQAC